jgi:hypothetical protein
MKLRVLREMVTIINRKYDAPQDTESTTDVAFYSPAIWFEHQMMTKSGTEVSSQLFIMKPLDWV